MKLSGRKVILLSSPLLAALSFSNIAFANDTSVKVVNNINTSNSTSGGSTTGRTDIVIECNGVKKEYHSDKAENVTLNCDDEISGTVKSEVKISNGGSVTPNPTIEEGKKKINEEVGKKTEEIKKEVKAAKDKIKEERKDLFEQMTIMFREFFKNFHI